MTELPQPIPFTPDWPEPDMTLLDPPRPQAPKLSPNDFARIYGPWSDWLTQAAAVKGAPVDYVAASLLAVASALIGNARWASPWSGWPEASILWVMLVGEPSAGKSPALDAVLDPLRQIEAEMAEAYITRRREWEEREEVARIAHAYWKGQVKAAMAEGKPPPAKPASAILPNQPIRERISITDTTTEQAANLLSQSWRGLILTRDELAGWLEGMDRYNGGGDRPFWLESFGGRSFAVDRKGTPEPIIIDHLSIAILGGTQPDKLSRLLVKADDDGLLARFLVVYPEAVPLARPIGQIDTQRLRAGYERLLSLTPHRAEGGQVSPILVPFSEDAAQALHLFREQCREWEAEASGFLKGHIGKLPGISARVANILAHLDWARGQDSTPPQEIGADHVARACHLVAHQMRPFAFRAYGFSAPSGEVRAMRRLAAYIVKERLERLTVRDIQRVGLSGMSLSREVQAAIIGLVQADWVRPMKDGGRTTYIVNPQALL